MVYTVTNGTDTPTSGTLTLRQALAAAADGDQIGFNLPAGASIDLQAKLFVNVGVTITGPGANLLTVQDASNQFRFTIFTVSASGSSPATISGLSIAGGRGGVINKSGSTLTLLECQIRSNRAPDGGGIGNDGTLNVVSSTVSENYAFHGFVPGKGGGIRNTGMLAVLKSTISNNTVGGLGGGIYNDGTITINSSTVAGNMAQVDPTTSYGGGIFNDTQGTAETSGNPNATVTIRNTIIAINETAAGAGSGNDGFGPFISQGYNLIGDNTDNTITGIATGNQFNVDPLLGPLQDNGGPTTTRALLSGSPATDKGSSGGNSSDQRGFSRPVDSPVIANASGGDGSDIGAFEDQNVCGDQIVTNNNDSGGGSLRAVIASACTGSTITFAPSVLSPINLTSGELTIPRPMIISGPGANLMTIQRGASAGSNFSIFHVSAGGNVNISGLTITKGNPSHDGGGIFVDNASLLFLANCAVVGNSANSAGALTASGGGIAAGGLGSPNVIVVRSTISGNSATNDGGGIAAGNLTVDTSTISGNTAARFGGGISVSGTSNFINSTVANNSAATGGGLRGNGYSVTASNSIFAKNNITVGDPDFSGTLTSRGYNLIGNTFGTTITGTTAGNLLNVDPLLGPLQNNGGPTATLALLPGSPAIDQGRPFGIAVPDQRGVNRPYDFPSIPNAPGGNGVDIGAFEAVPGGLQVTSITRLTTGHIMLRGLYVANLSVTVQASADLQTDNFVPIGAATTDASGALQYDDAGAVNLTKRFYRLASP